MTDLHSHILFGIDDGSNNIEESLEMINKLSSLGFNNIVCTPHYIEGTSYNANNKEKKALFTKLKRKTKVNLILGNEIFINKKIDEYINDGNIMPINDKYLLIELPLNNDIKDALDIFYELKIKGYQVILAHPERYEYFHKNYKVIDRFKENEILFQCNYDSIIGYYGSKAKKLFKYLLKKNWVDYLGTDVHHSNSKFFDNFGKMEKKIIKYIGKDNYQKIVANGDNIIK